MLPLKTSYRYAICVEDADVLVVDATSARKALERVEQVRHAVQPINLNSPFTVREMQKDETARVKYFRDSYFQPLSQTRH